MPKSRGTRLIAKRQLDAAAEVNHLDYFERFTKRKRPNDDSNDPDAASKVLQKQPDDRAARIARREAAKLGQTLGVRGQVVSSRQQTAQRSEEGDDEDESDTAAEDDGDDDDEDGGPDGVDHARITQAMNQARNRTMKPTINGIGSRQQGNQPQDTEVSSDAGEDSHEDLLESQSPDDEEVPASRNANDRPRSKLGANGKAPQQKNQRTHDGRDRRKPKDKTNTSSPDEDESEGESPSESNNEVAEDTAFVEAPEQDEETVTVKVVINSMGGIFRTLQHPAWTGSSHWTREFDSDNNDDGQKTCKTSSGKALMDEIQGLNDILEEATNPPDDPFDNDHDHDLTSTTPTAYLRTRSVDIQQHLTRIDRVIDEICSRNLLPVSRAGSERFAARCVKRRQALLRDMSRQLIPMLIITVKKACGICPSEENRSKTTLYLNCFRLQFFLRPLAWADRLHKALERGLEQWPGGNESHDGTDESHEGGHEALDTEKKARSTLESQLAALYSAVRQAEREIQQIATQSERQEREAEIKRQERERKIERQREIAAQKQREKEEQDRKIAKGFQVFFQDTWALRSQPDPLKKKWDDDQATLPEQFRATSTVKAAPGRSSSGHAARSQGGPSRNARVESVSDSDDPFSDNYRHRSNTPMANRHASSNRVRQNPPSGLGRSQQARNASRPWSDEEDKVMIRAIRYKRNYDVVSMAQRLRRSEDDVARKATFLKQAYREAYTEKGCEIPAWAL